MQNILRVYRYHFELQVFYKIEGQFFYGDVPLVLVKDREQIYFEHFWNDLVQTQKNLFWNLTDKFMPKLMLKTEACVQDLPLTIEF